MKRPELIRVAVVALCFSNTLYGTALAGRIAPKPRARPAVVKMIGDQLTFDPPTLIIKKGQTVEWQNQSRQVHNILDDPSKAQNKADAGLPVAAQPFDSGYVNPGQNYTHRFTGRGTYRYVCTLHEPQGMKGKIIVK